MTAVAENLDLSARELSRCRSDRAVLTGLSAAETARILALADEYAAASIEAHSRTPRCQMDDRRRAETA